MFETVVPNMSASSTLSVSNTIPVGFANLGNTCFLNVVLQVLRMFPPLQGLFHPSKERQRVPRKGSKKIGLLTGIQELMFEIQEKREGECVAPRAFLSALWKTIQDCDDDWYRPRQQADAAECLQYILDGLHDAVYRKVDIVIDGQPRNAEERAQMKALESWSSFFAKEYSPVVEHFYGQTQARIQCKTCKNISDRYEPWSSLKVPIPGAEVPGGDAPSLVEALNYMFKTEEIEDYACDHCNSKQPALKQERISKLPNILTLSLKRFTNRGQKIRGLISWDLETMQFDPWMAFGRSPFTGRRGYDSFRTFAVIEHQGSSYGGHYHMYARSMNVGTSDWKNYDDCAIRSVDASAVISPDSYIMFMVPVEKPSA